MGESLGGYPGGIPWGDPSGGSPGRILWGIPWGDSPGDPLGGSPRGSPWGPPERFLQGIPRERPCLGHQRRCGAVLGIAAAAAARTGSGTSVEPLRNHVPLRVTSPRGDTLGVPPGGCPWRSSPASLPPLGRYPLGVAPWPQAGWRFPRGCGGGSFGAGWGGPSWF